MLVPLRVAGPERRRWPLGSMANRDEAGGGRGAGGTTVGVTLGVLAGALVGEPEHSILGRGGGRGGRRAGGRGVGRGRGRRRRRQRGQRGAEPFPPENCSWSQLSCQVAVRLIGFWEVELRLTKEARSATLGHTRHCVKISKNCSTKFARNDFARLILPDDEDDSVFLSRKRRATKIGS